MRFKTFLSELRGNTYRVFKHPDDPKQVIKVPHSNDDYLEFVRANQGNKYVPELVKNDEMASQLDKQGFKGALFQEKLTPLTTEAYNNFLALLCHLAGRTSNSVAGLTLSWGKIAQDSTDKDLQAMAKFFHAHVESGGKLDMTRKNIMMRGDQIVFLDPLH